MSDLICRNTMVRCQTPGMCSPHGGCNPQAPVALTGNRELDQLRHDCDKWEALYRAEHASCTRVLDTLIGFRTERDQLKAQVEKFQAKKALCGLHEKASCLECMWPPPEKSEVTALKAEVEALRKDAERYRWLRRDTSEGKVDLCIMRKHWSQDLLSEVLALESADQQIDAAMGKGEQP